MFGFGEFGYFHPKLALPPLLIFLLQAMYPRIWSEKIDLCLLEMDLQKC